MAETSDLTLIENMLLQLLRMFVAAAVGYYIAAFK